MRPFAGWWCWPLVCVLLLGGCRGVGVREPGPDDHTGYRERAARIAAFAEWGFTGRLSMDDGEQGGSGTLRWKSGPADTSLDFRGAMGRGAWRLQITPAGAVLEEGDGYVQAAPDVETLVLDRIGWVVPIDALGWWVRGLAAPGKEEGRVMDADGRLARLRQFGWEIDFERYHSAGGEELPAKLQARRGDHRVKLAVGNWRLGPE